MIHSPVGPALLLAAVALPVWAQEPPEGFYVREGYRVEPVLPDLRGARFLEFDDQGVLFVSRPSSGDIVTFQPAESGYRSLGAFVGGYRARDGVHGMHFFEGWMWFTTTSGVHRARDTDGDGRADEVIDVLTGLPGGGHWWRPILVTPGGFYTSIGDSGNITDETATDRQKLWFYSLDARERHMYSSGIRNTEKYRLRPGTTEVWGFDHGSDWFGRQVGDRQGNQPITDLIPPDELNLYVDGAFYGHPFIVGDRLPRYEYLEKPDIHELAARTTPPEWPVGSHWACNGWTFVEPARTPGPGAMPASLHGDILVAAHGSWNSSRPVGYCVARVLFDKDPGSDRAGRPFGLEKIVGTLDVEGRVRARPVDCVQAPDGTILFSSDQPGAVYRLTYVGPVR